MLYLASLFLFPLTARAAYSALAASYNSGNIFNEFNFYTGGDPTNGFVSYQSQASASASGLIRNEGTSAYIGVDTWSQPSGGRASVRMESKRTFQRGLFILDASHMPTGCGTWPAFWTLGEGGWPNSGEIDIFEGVHEENRNTMALHTSDGCTITGSGATGQLLTSNCYVWAPGQSSNAGCSFKNWNTNTFGASFNAGGGGVIAMEWNSQFIKVWQWPRGNVPSNVYSNNPAPENWGAPVSLFQGNCDINSKFKNHRIIINTTFCGDWAGNTWGSSSCASRAGSCADFVRYNPGAFTEAYWRINSLRVFSS